MPVRLEISRACHCKAGTRPRSSSMEGRSNSAMLRTTFTLLSASLRMDSTWLRNSASPGATAPRLPSSIKSALSDWPTSSCNSRETWKPGFYPAKLPAKQFLHHYAQRLNSVEINYTFRRLPSASTLQNWVEATPPGFVFAVKANQRLTHILRLKNDAE